MRHIGMAVVAAGVVAVSAPVQAQEVTLAQAVDLAQQALGACAAQGYAASVSVVDVRGVTRVTLRADGAAKAPVAAPLKAATAALYNLPGSEMEPRLNSDPAFRAAIEAHPELYNAHAGSLPLTTADGQVIGGLAIADVPHRIADACVRAAVEAPQNRQDILALVEKVADYQITAMAAGLNPIRTGEAYPAPKGWVQGALFVGLTALAEHSNKPHYKRLILQRGEANRWALGSRKYFADDQAIGQAYLWAATHGAGEAARAAVRAELDAILAAPSDAPLTFTEHRSGTGPEALGCQARWCWADALFMAPSIWLDMSLQTGDPRYADFAKKEFRATTDFLFDPEENLYFRDSRFFERRDAQGRKLFWSRGDGWVFAGLARMIERLPENDPDRPYLIGLFQKMAIKLKALQKADGYWAPSLLDNGPDTPPETSGTGFYVYGLAWGINQGLLEREAYEPAVRKGWAALTRAVHPDGKLGYVQPVSDRPDQVGYEDTQLYGVGAFLLAGTAVADLK